MNYFREDRVINFLIIMIAFSSGLCFAELRPEPIGLVETLPENSSPHWVWVNDMVYNHMPDGRASLIDGDSGKFLGLLNTGYSFNSLTLPSKGSEIYSAETYYSRHTRGERTDVVSIYELMTLSLIAEIKIPNKRASTIPTIYNAAMTDNDRFMGIFNYTPAQSLSIVDVVKREFIGEIPISGCALVYPAGDLSFASICGDGSLLITYLNEDGTLYDRIRTRSFFDPIEDPVTETPVRHDGIWHFVSFKGLVHRVDLRHKKAKFLKPWSLFTPQENDQNWRVGGQQHIAISDHYGKLYSIHHKGSGDMPNSAKDPGDEVWVYDINKKKRVQKIALKRIANEIQVTKDKHPLLFAAFVAIPEIDVYDAISGEFLRTITEIGMTPTGLLVQ